MALKISTRWSATATIRCNTRKLCASKSIIFHDSKLSFFSIDSTKIDKSCKTLFVNSRNKQRFSNFYSISYLNITMNGTITLGNGIIIAHLSRGSSRKSRYSPTCFDREAVKKNTEPRSSWNQNKIYVAIHEHWRRVDVSGAKRKYRYS